MLVSADWQSILLQIDPLSFIVALLALWIAWADYRRNNYVIVNVIECQCSHPMKMDENKGQLFHHFRVLIRNHGLPLYGVMAILSFNDEHGGSVAIPLKKAGERNGTHDEFARGMVAEFYFKSYELNKASLACLLLLKNMRKQDAHLRLYSSGYFARDIRIGGFVEWTKSIWNVVAYQLNRPFKRTVTKDEAGRPVKKHYNPFRQFVNISWALRNFIEKLSREAGKNSG